MAKRYPKAEINGKYYEIHINPDCVKLKKDICAPCAFYDICGPFDDKGFKCNLVAGCYYKECNSSKVMPGHQNKKGRHSVKDPTEQSTQPLMVAKTPPGRIPAGRSKYRVGDTW